MPAVKKGQWPEDDLTSDEIKTIQAKLLTLGYAPGRIDGVWGPNTEGAIKAFRRSTAWLRMVTGDQPREPNFSHRWRCAIHWRRYPSIGPPVIPTVPPTTTPEVEAIVAALLPILLARLAPIIIQEVTKAIKDGCCSIGVDTADRGGSRCV